MPNASAREHTQHVEHEQQRHLRPRIIRALSFAVASHVAESSACQWQL